MFSVQSCAQCSLNCRCTELMGAVYPNSPVSAFLTDTAGSEPGRDKVTESFSAFMSLAQQVSEKVHISGESLTRWCYCAGWLYCGHDFSALAVDHCGALQSFMPHTGNPSHMKLQTFVRCKQARG